MPTRPDAPQDIQSEWQRIYPVVTNQKLNAAWGMDATDMWAVGDRGTILHYDGRGVSTFEQPITTDLVAIDGCARDEIWAVSTAGHVLRWDGRSWSVAMSMHATLRSVLCSGPDDVYIGGRPLGLGYPTIWHHDGVRWTGSVLPNSTPVTAVRKIWRPGPDRPLMAAADSGLYFLVGGFWHQTTMDGSFRAASQDIVITNDPDSFFPWDSAIHRLQAGGSAIRLCPDHLISHAFKAVVRSRALLLASSGTIRRLNDCVLSPLVLLPFDIGDLSVPLLPGVSGRDVIAVGELGGFARLTWHADDSLAVDWVLSQEDNHQARKIMGDAEHLFLQDGRNKLLRRESRTWREMEAPLSVMDFEMTADGALAILGGGGAAFLVNEEHWQEMPALAAGSIWRNLWWAGPEQRMRVVILSRETGRWELWGLDGSTWSRMYDLCEEMHHATLRPQLLDGSGPNDLFLHLGVADRFTVLHHDGHGLQRVLPDRDLNIRRFFFGRKTGRLYMEGDDEHGAAFSAYLEGDNLMMLHNMTGYYNLWEVTEDLVFCSSFRKIHQLRDDRWVEWQCPDDQVLNDIWGHLDQGLFLISDNQVFHRNLPGGSP